MWEYVDSLGTHGSFHPKYVFGGQTIFRNEIVNMGGYILLGVLIPDLQVHKQHAK
jgi:hypothetical protein